MEMRGGCWGEDRRTGRLSRGWSDPRRIAAAERGKTKQAHGSTEEHSLRRTSDHFPHKASISPGGAIRNLEATGMSPPAGDRPWGWLPTGSNEATLLLSIAFDLGQNSSTGQTKGPEHILWEPIPV